MPVAINLATAADFGQASNQHDFIERNFANRCAYSHDIYTFFINAMRLFTVKIA